MSAARVGRPSGQPHRLAVMQVQRDQHDAQQFWLALLDAVRQACAPTSRAEPPAPTPDFNAPAMVDRCCRSSPMLVATSRWLLMICMS